MAIPHVPFPPAQAEVKDIHETLVKHLRALQTEVRIAQEMLKVLRTFCNHPNKIKYGCPDCGLNWSD